MSLVFFFFFLLNCHLERLGYYLHKLCQELWPPAALKYHQFLNICRREHWRCTWVSAGFSYSLTFIQDHLNECTCCLNMLHENVSVLRTLLCALLHAGLLHIYLNCKRTVYVRHFYAAFIFLSLGGSISVSWPLTPLTHSALDLQGNTPWLMHLHVRCMCLFPLVSLRWHTLNLKGRFIVAAAACSGGWCKMEMNYLDLC